MCGGGGGGEIGCGGDYQTHSPYIYIHEMRHGVKRIHNHTQLQ